MAPDDSAGAAVIPGFAMMCSPKVAGGGGPVPNLFTALAVTPKYAYSLRKLFSGYGGSAIRVRRSSDNTEQDIGFVGNDLDTASLLSFCGAGDGYVKTWYDQQATGNWTQSTAANQPRIVIAGVLDVFTGILPGMVFDGVNDIFVGAASTTGSPFTRGAVLKFLSVASGQNITSDGVANSLYFSASGALATYSGASSVIKSGISANDIAVVTERPNLKGTYNGATVTTASGTTALLRHNLGGASSGGAGSSCANIMACESILFASQLSDANVGILQANQKAYWGTP